MSHMNFPILDDVVTLRIGIDHNITRRMIQELLTVWPKIWLDSYKVCLLLRFVTLNAGRIPIAYLHLLADMEFFGAALVFEQGFSENSKVAIIQRQDDMKAFSRMLLDQRILTSGTEHHMANRAVHWWLRNRLSTDIDILVHNQKILKNRAGQTTRQYPTKNQFKCGNRKLKKSP